MLTIGPLRWIKVGAVWQRVLNPSWGKRQRAPDGQSGFISETLWLPLALGIFALTVGMVVGWQMGRAPLELQLSQQAALHQRQAVQQQADALNTLQQANVRGDMLTRQLAQAQAQITQLSESQRHAITRVTAGRACLGAAAVSLLNNPANLPAPGADAAATSSAADASGSAATDADVLGWAIAASASHEQCRARLDALIDWHEDNHDH